MADKVKPAEEEALGIDPDTSARLSFSVALLAAAADDVAAAGSADEDEDPGGTGRQEHFRDRESEQEQTPTADAMPRRNCWAEAVEFPAEDRWVFIVCVPKTISADEKKKDGRE